MELTLPESSLIVFVDDTGHERLVKGHNVYGLGGCVVMANDLDRAVRQPWQAVRLRVTGSADIALHAASFARTATQQQIEAVAEFFRRQPFARIGATVSVKSRLTGNLGPINVIAGALKNRILDIAKWTRFTEVHIVFESSDRADRHVERAFGEFKIAENGVAIPVECYFMPKSMHDPALEVADFIMHAVGRQARRKTDGKDGFEPDFAAVFHGQDTKRVSYIDVDRVESA